jgi:hypothetical protein
MPLSEGRLLVLSPFEGVQKRRITGELAQQRNRFVSYLAASVLIPHSVSGSATENLCRELSGEGKRVHSLSDILVPKSF